MPSQIRSPLPEGQSFFKTVKPPKKYKGLRRVSERRQATEKLYAEKRKRFLEEHKFCQVGKCWQYSHDVHHKNGRTGRNYLDESTWMSVCRGHHACIHDNPAWARENGFLI